MTFLRLKILKNFIGLEIYYMILIKLMIIILFIFIILETFLKLDLKYPQFNLGFKWIVRIRCGFKFNTSIAIRRNLVTNE